MPSRLQSSGTPEAGIAKACNAKGRMRRRREYMIRALVNLKSGKDESLKRIGLFKGIYSQGVLTGLAATSGNTSYCMSVWTIIGLSIVERRQAVSDDAETINVSPLCPFNTISHQRSRLTCGVL